MQQILLNFFFLRLASFLHFHFKIHGVTGKGEQKRGRERVCKTEGGDTCIHVESIVN